MKTSLTTLARPPARDVLRRAGATLAAALATVLIFALTTSLAEAANHALIMTIGTYSKADANLPGIEIDAGNAVRIAEAMGVPRSNVLRLNDRQLSAAGIRDALAGLGKRVGRGDGVFVYYSGHGTQTASAAGKCSEGLLAYDMQVYPDSELEQALGELSSKAGQLVMMNDSCFSGGAAVKALPLAGRKAKFYRLASATADYQCGHALNMKFHKNIVPVAAERGANMLYVAAAADTEIAHATSAGSAATTAWIDCLRQASSDRDRSGGFSGTELRACAQQVLDQQRFDQHIVLEGNAQLPLAYVGSGADAKPALVDAAAALQAIRSGASPAVAVSLKASMHRMRIGQDELDFEVRTQQAGYLSVLHVGSDGKTFDLLFPNELDANNHIAAGGSVRLPRPSWRAKAGGPAGTSWLMAVVSEKPRDFRKTLTRIERTPFHQAPANATSAKNLVVEARGEASVDPGRYGASEPVPIEEY